MTHEEKQRCIELRYKKSRTPKEESEFNLLLAKWAKSFTNQ